MQTETQAEISPTTDLDTGKLLSLYREMMLIRKTEEQLARSYQMGKIPGACHTYVGQEAVAVGVCAHLRTNDVVFSTHRGHGHALAKGVPPRELIAELYGRATGCSKGRGGSMHLFSPEVGLMGTTGIVGPNILQATGAGYSFRLLKTDQVGVAFFGDGAVSNGAFHEGLNLAAIWDLPVLYVCENNLYATEVPFGEATRNTDVTDRARSYGMPGIAVDGNDVVAVYTAAGEAVRRARAGSGPSLLECRTYRTRPHAEGMRDGGYRTQEEIDDWKTRDPITELRMRLLASETASDRDLAAIDTEITESVADALTFALESPYPDLETAANHIFSDKPSSVIP
jgi:TPP-dependent pyruvate/acetoin dehydrogenase alpha subunit